MRKEGQSCVAKALAEGAEELSDLPVHGLPRERKEVVAAMFSLFVLEETEEGKDGNAITTYSQLHMYT